jgi:hypothetical protein
MHARHLVTGAILRFGASGWPRAREVSSFPVCLSGAAGIVRLFTYSSLALLDVRALLFFFYLLDVRRSPHHFGHWVTMACACSDNFTGF